MTNANLISALRNMVDDIDNLGAAPMTVDVNVLRQAIAALTPPEGWVRLPRDPTEEMIRAYDAQADRADGSALRLEAYRAMIAARPEVSP